jgi:anti-anti-sigma regulatory factor
MLRITRGDIPDADRILLRLAGDVRGRWVDELRRACDEAIVASNGEAPRRLVLDLGQVLFIDPIGLALFHELSAGPVHFTNCSPFVAEQLKGLAHDCD